MRPTAWTGGVAALAAVLGAAGLLFDAPAAAAGAAGLAALLAARAALFLWRTGAVADGIVVDRKIERPNVKQGEPVGVVTRVAVPPVDGLSVTLSDLPPASAVYDPREVYAIQGSIRYWVRLTVPGQVGFRGLLLATRDRFFAAELPLTAPRFAGTTVTVLAFGVARSAREAGFAMGELERDRRSVLRGQGVRSYRPYRSGDDPDLVDWKLSAKHGRYFVREPTGQSGGPPLVAVDLPGAGTPMAADLLSAAAGALEVVVREFGAASLLVVAGGEVVAFRDADPDLASLVRLLEVRTGDPVAPLYRARDPAALRARLREAERSAAAPARRFAAAVQANLAGGVRTPFEQDLDRALRASGHRDVVLYAAGAGDPSHLALLGAAVRRRGRRLRVLLARPDPAAAAWLAPYGPVEAL